MHAPLTSIVDTDNFLSRVSPKYFNLKEESLEKPHIKNKRITNENGGMKIGEEGKEERSTSDLNDAI